MLKTFKYRLYPTKQQRLLGQQLEECRWLYNHLMRFLAERREVWERRQESLLYYDQATTFPWLKAERPTLASVHSSVLRTVAVCIDLAFEAFFRRSKAGEAPRYPRFRGRRRCANITDPQASVGCKVEADGKRLRLYGVGQVKIILHRPLEGMATTATISRSTGKWSV